MLYYLPQARKNNNNVKQKVELESKQNKQQFLYTEYKDGVQSGLE